MARLRLDKDGLYVIEVYRTRAGNKPDEVYYPTDAAGNRLNEIGFSFMGAFNNEPKPGPMPMYALCAINVAHYRNSADYEEAVYQLGQPTAWFGGLTEQWVKEVLGGAIRLGSRTAIPLPAQSTAGLLQVSLTQWQKKQWIRKKRKWSRLARSLSKRRKRNAPQPKRITTTFRKRRSCRQPQATSARRSHGRLSSLRSSSARKTKRSNTT
jgi:hypothetical protein